MATEPLLPEDFDRLRDQLRDAEAEIERLRRDLGTVLRQRAGLAAQERRRRWVLP